MRTLLANAGPIAHLAGEGSLIGDDFADTEKLVTPAGMAILVEGDKIGKIVNSQEALDEFGTESNNDIKIIDLEGKAVIPGLVDSHTHLLWDGDRSREVSWRLEGHSYTDIANMGGGINYTVAATRGASKERLFELGYKRIRQALTCGTTHLEAKSGYGLSTESELKLIEVANSLKNVRPLPSLDLTWLGAHATPEGYTRQQYVEEIQTEQLPAVLEQGLARSADVFCEDGWFTVEESEDILKQAKAGGMELRLHIDEFKDCGGGQLAADLEVSSADHSHYTPLDARKAMHEAGVNTGFLPGTPYSMGEQWPDFNMMTDEGLLWSVASDFNPNCRTLSLPFIGSILTQRCGVDPLVALAATSRNPSETTPHRTGLVHGRIQEGGVASLNVVDGPFWQAWCLQPGINPFHATMLEGEMVFH